MIALGIASLGLANSPPFHTLGGDKIAREWPYFDPTAISAQLGIA